MKLIMFLQAFFAAVNTLADAAMKVSIGAAAVLIALSLYR